MSGFQVLWHFTKVHPFTLVFKKTWFKGTLDMLLVDNVPEVQLWDQRLLFPLLPPEHYIQQCRNSTLSNKLNYINFGLSYSG